MGLHNKSARAYVPGTDSALWRWTCRFEQFLELQANPILTVEVSTGISMIDFRPDR
jgi:hypothetical protein